LHAGLVTTAHDPEATLAELPRLYADADRRRRMVAQLGEDAWATRPVWSWYDALSPAEQATVAGPLLNRLRPWQSRAAIRQLIGVARPKWSFDEVLSSGKILLISLAAGAAGRETANQLGAMLIDGLWRAITARSAAAPPRRRRLSVVIDEWQDFTHLPVDLADALALARGYRAALTLANQSPAQLPAELRSAAFSQARSKIALSLGAHDAAVFAKELGEPVTAEDLTWLGRYEGIARLVVGNETTAPFSFRTRALSSIVSNGEDLRRRSHRRYGFPRAEVEAAIRQRLEPPTPTGDVGRRRRS
jgi:hypothetical protein